MKTTRHHKDSNNIKTRILQSNRKQPNINTKIQQQQTPRIAMHSKRSNKTHIDLEKMSKDVVTG